MVWWLPLVGCDGGPGSPDADPPTTEVPPPTADTGPRILDVDEADAAWIGVGAGDWAGRHVSVAGDLDDDGVRDLLVSALWNDDAAEDAGAVYVLPGPATGGGSLALAPTVLRGEEENDAAGVSASSAGDLDADGFDDVIVGADGHDAPFANAGVVYVLRGPLAGARSLAGADAILYGESNGDLAGVSVGGPGDTNGDGFDDVLVGARYDDQAAEDAGAVYLLRGPLAGPQSLAAADAKILGEGAGDWLGLTVSPAGDIDGDGLSDVAAGAVYTAAGGTVYVLRGPVAGVVGGADADARLLAEAPGDRAGRIGAGGDADGDGHDDLWIGAPGNDAGGIDAGAVYFVSGVDLAGTVELAAAGGTLDGEAAGNETGNKVAYAGDLDGDGHGDVLVGAWLDDTGGSNAGACYLVFGPVAGVRDLATADRIWRGKVPADMLGAGVAAGDLDGDGRADLVLGSLKQDDGALDAGAAYVVLATSLGL